MSKTAPLTFSAPKFGLWLAPDLPLAERQEALSVLIKIMLDPPSSPAVRRDIAVRQALSLYDGPPTQRAKELARGRDRYFLDTSRALAISRRSHAWLYKNARRFGFGWQLPSGSWAYSEMMLRNFMAGRVSACEENQENEKNARPPLSVSPESRHYEIRMGNEKEVKVTMSKTITLSFPVKWHHGTITRVILREPKYRDFMTLGLPSTWVNVLGGGGFEQENVQALAEWIERLADCEPNVLEFLSLQDTLALRGAVRDFFTESAPKMDSTPSTDLSEDLSSNSASTLGPSTI